MDQKTDRISAELIDFLDRSPNAFFAVHNMKGMLAEAGFRELKECGVDFVTSVQATDREVLDLLAKYGIGCIAGMLPGWWGGDGSNAGRMRASRPKGVYEAQLAEYLASLDHPAIWMLNLCDEPSALDLPYLGEVSDLVAARAPKTPAYLNLYPNYASVSKNTGAETRNQLGTKTYAEHIDVYCRTVPLDYISYDFYPYTTPETMDGFISRMYDNFIVVADACRRTKRSFWYIPQVNSRAGIPPTSVNQLRFQANAALSFGAEAVTWACWCKGWWENNVLDADGKPTEQYGKLKLVNAELREVGPHYMRFRNVATRLVGFAAGSPQRPSLPFADTPRYAGYVRASNGAPLIVGEMAARDPANGEKAFYVTAADDPGDAHNASFDVVFSPKGKRVEAFNGSGRVPAKRLADGSCAVPISSCGGVLLVIGPAAQ